MAVLKNISPDRRSLFAVSAPPVDAGDEITISDERVIGRAWAKTVWDVVKPPKGCTDVGPDDAFIFEPKQQPEPAPDSESTPTKDGN